MNKSQLKIPLTALSLLLPLIAMVVCFKLAPKNASPKLINNVDTVALFKIFDRKPYSPSVEAKYVRYQTQPAKDWRISRGQKKTEKQEKGGVLGSVLIGVHPTTQAAHNSFVESSFRAVAEAKNPNPKIGSEFKCWYSPIENGDRKGGNCLLRIDNCVINFAYEGKLQDMIALARKVEAGLQTEAIAQRGDLKVPQLSMSWPKQVRTGSRFKVDFSSSSPSEKSNPVLVNVNDSAKPIHESQFSLYERAPQSAGAFKRKFVMATLGNVILTETVQLNALTTQQADAARLPQSDEN